MSSDEKELSLFRFSSLHVVLLPFTVGSISLADSHVVPYLLIDRLSPSTAESTAV